jgi:hypothetical protein
VFDRKYSALLDISPLEDPVAGLIQNTRKKSW